MINFSSHIEFANACLSDLWTLHLTFVGILLSLFTLFYSFIINKKDELKLITEFMNLGKKDPLMVQKRNFAIAYIKRLRIINTKCFYIFVASTILSFLSWISMRLLCENYRWLALIIIFLLTIFIMFYIAKVAFKIWVQYKNDIKI